MPTLSPALMSRLTPLRTRGSPSRYLMLRELRLIWPLQKTRLSLSFLLSCQFSHLSGHWSGPGSPATVQSASLGRLVWYSLILSTLTMLFSI